MKYTIIALIITLSVAVAVVQVVRVGHQRAEFEREVVELERQVAHYQTMLDDAHAYYPVLELRVVKISTDLTPREVMWTMAEQFREAGVEVNFH